MVAASTILKDSIFFIKNFIDTNVTDPIQSTRPSGQEWVLTSYPTRPVTYPIVTIKDLNSMNEGMLGMQSEAAKHYITIEIRIWANTVSQRDKLADTIYQQIKDNQIGVSGTSQANALHDLRLLSSVNLDDPSGPKCKIMTIKYLFIAV